MAPFAVTLDAAAGSVTLREFATRGVAVETPAAVIALITAIGLTLFTGVISAITDWNAVTSRASLLVGLACLCLVVGYIFTIQTVRVGDLSVSAPFRYTTLLGAVVLGYLIFDEVPDALTIAGCCIIVASGEGPLLQIVVSAGQEVGTPATSPHERRDTSMPESKTQDSHTQDRHTQDRQMHDQSDGGGVHMSYVRFGAMILTSTVVMFGLMYLNTFALDHVRWSETRFYMAILMGATMAIIMLGFMLSMYRDTRLNVAIALSAVALFGGSLWLVRSQETVQDESWMRAMIPHHSIAILTSERAEIDDYRVCELAVGIIEAQRREIDEMKWLVSDISENGPAETAQDAEARPIPEFSGTSERTCGETAAGE